MKRYCIDYVESIKNEEKSKNISIENCKNLNDAINNEYKKIQDPVFLKQMKLLKSSAYCLNESFDLKDAYDQYISDVNCIIESIIPDWLSNLCFVFNHKCRQAVYENIIKNYVLISLYLDFEINKTRNRFNDNILAIEEEYKKKVMSEYNKLINKIENKIFI